MLQKREVHLNNANVRRFEGLEDLVRGESLIPQEELLVRDAPDRRPRILQELNGGVDLARKNGA